MYTHSDSVAIALTVRNGSDRLPNKAMIEFDGKPLFLWIADRLSVVTENVVIATTCNTEDNSIASAARSYGLDVYRHPDEDDVMSRVINAAREYSPSFIMRALGDCPFIDPNIISLAVDTIDAHDADAFLWHLSPDVLPVYGSREFPYPVSTWDVFDEMSVGEEREHTDMYFNRSRKKFNVVYHEPPPMKYFRSYRLEVDYEEDVSFLRAIHNEIGIGSSLRDVISLLDTRPDIVHLNIDCVEKTGIIKSYSNRERRRWYKAMMGHDIVMNNGDIMYSNGSEQVFCVSGSCHVGNAKNGVLVTNNGSRVSGNAFITCNCGSGVFWHNKA